MGSLPFFLLKEFYSGFKEFTIFNTKMEKLSVKQALLDLLYVDVHLPKVVLPTAPLIAVAITVEAVSDSS